MSSMFKKTAPQFALLLTALVSSLTLFLPAYAQGISVLRDAEIEQWIEDYSYPIFEAAQLDPESINFLIIGDQTPNAFASGRTMGIFTGLITTADNPNQVEGVIAHEAGHMAGGHGARRAEAFANASRPILLSLVLAAAAIAAGAPEAGIGLLGLGQQIGTVTALTYTRGQEASADQAAVSYLDSVGRSSEGLVEFFGKLRNSQIITSRRINPYLQTHPLANQRVTALTQRVTTSPYLNVKDDEASMARFRLMKAKIKGFLQQPKFTLREYPLSDKSDPGRYARAVAYYRGTDLDSALVEINALLEKHPNNPYFQELKGQMLFEFGHVAESVEPHRRSVELAPTKALLRVNLGRALLATDNTAQVGEAVTVLKSALQLEPDNSFGWFELARAYGFLGDEGRALLSTAESRYSAGAKPDAAQFARRAISKFERGTPEWHQAQDIIVAVTNEASRSGRRGNSQQRQGRQGGPGNDRNERPDDQQSPDGETSEAPNPEDQDEVPLPDDSDVETLPEAPPAPGR